MPGINRLCVFCGSSSGLRPAYLEAATAVGTLLAQRGIYYKLYQLQYKDQELLAVSPPTLTPATD